MILWSVNTMKVKELNHDHPNIARNPKGNKVHPATKENRDVVVDKEYDGLTDITGIFGRWQITIETLLAISIAFHNWQMLANKWLTYKTDHWCARPENLTELSVEQWLNMSAPLTEDGSFDRCHVFDLQYSVDSVRPDGEAAVVPCYKWEYDESVFQNTIIKRWDLVCDNKNIPRVVQIIFFIGNFVGVLASGIFADNFGRKPGYCLFLTLWIVFGVIAPFVPNLWGWTFCRFMIGAMSLGYNNIHAVHSLELTSGKYRSLVGHYFGEVGWNAGFLALGGIAYGIPNCYHMELMIALSATPWLLAWFLLPESPRWLLAKGKTEEAKVIMRQACKWNGKPTEEIDNFADNYLSNNKAEDKTKANIFDLFRLPATRRNTIVMSYAWLSFSMVYFGVAYNLPAFDWNIYLVFIFPACVLIPFSFIVPFLENSLGRKFMLTGALTLSGTMLLLCMFLPKEHPAIVVSAMVGLITISAAFGAGYNFTKELFPTVLRATALSTASAAARIGSILSPFIALLDSVNEVLPLVVYGGFALSAGCLSIWIWPETKNIRLPDTVEECEEYASGQNEWTAKMFCQKKRSRVV